MREFKLVSYQRFKDRVVIITGAASGMGKQTALDFAEEGATVIASDIDREELELVKKQILTNGGKCESIICDVANKVQVDNLVKETISKYNKIDILINNAGFLTSGTIEETTDELIDLTIDINLKSVLYFIRAVTPIMKKQKYGRIVNVSSITGKNGDNSTIFAYGAAKGAIISLTRSVARQLGPFGITCNSIAPHAVMTKMMQYWDEEKRNEIANKIPVKRLGTVEDMSSLMRYLSTEEASFITGETVNINGGYYMD